MNFHRLIPFYQRNHIPKCFDEYFVGNFLFIDKFVSNKKILLSINLLLEKAR
jgi:hypothetical protein